LNDNKESKDKMTPHEINDKDNFIMGWRFEDTTFCDAVVGHYETQTPSKGMVGNFVVIPEIKDSLEVALGWGPHTQLYFAHLQKCVDAYVEKYKYSNENAAWQVFEYVNIQKYPIKGGYHKWHCERNGYTPMTNARHLAFMTYLNDVTDEGETEFFYQKLKVTPEKGLTLIWPADWTFTHRGIPSPTQEKMIVTGWFNYKTPGV
jgi:hypothetical protein